jgi:hypothetical protein
LAGYASKKNPGLRIKLISEERALKLEYGEAHLAIRAGVKPIGPDNIVKHLLPVQFGMYAHKNYVKEMGKIQSSDDISRHKYVLNTSIPIMSMHKWIADNIPLNNVVFKSSNHVALEKAVIDGNSQVNINIIIYYQT